MQKKGESMLTMNELLTKLGSEEIVITSVQREETDQGVILNIHLQPMKDERILWMSVSIPEEAVDEFNLADCGMKWERGMKNLTDYLNKQNKK